MSRNNVTMYPKPSPSRAEGTACVNTPHVIAMVGLPARGKTYMSKKLATYLNWIGIKTRCFNLGEYRRQISSEAKCHDYFRYDNPESVALRAKCVVDALEDVWHWLESHGEIAIFDATNSTIDRRNIIHEVVVNKMKFKLFFVESLCSDPRRIEKNIIEAKTSSPDYANVDTDSVLTDFMQRIEHYKEKYQPLDEVKEKDRSFMKIYNEGEKVMVHKHEGHTQARIVYFLMNIHTRPRIIFLSRHGESEYNIQRRIGGDSDITLRGQQYAAVLVDYLEKQQIPGLKVWTSLLKRTIQTAAGIPAPQERWKVLNEINAGIFEDMTYADIAKIYPDVFAARKQNKFFFKYLRGESYEDVITRLEPVVMELERQGNVLVISHRAILRCLLGYFLGINREDIPSIEIPLHTLIKLTPTVSGWKAEFITSSVSSADSFEPF